MNVVERERPQAIVEPERVGLRERALLIQWSARTRLIIHIAAARPPAAQ
jgi:hypothetical protein